MIKLKQAKGFTLLEVLIASAILFSSIAITTLIFKSSYIASEKAQKRIEQAGVMPALLMQIQEDLRAQSTTASDQLAGQGVIWGLAYQWKAELISFKSPPDQFDNDTGLTESKAKRFKLWQVELALDINKKRLDFQYHEISWLR